MERIGAEIDKRVDARIGEGGGKRQRPARQPAAGAHGAPVTWAGAVLALGSMGLGVGVTAVVLNTSGSGQPTSGQIFLALMIWVILGAVNVASARRR